MGPKERIIAEEDRLFLTSLGNWTGPTLRWKADPSVPFWSALFSLSLGIASAKERLSYPAVLVEPNGTGTFRIYFSTWIPPDLTILTLTVSDGNYLFEKTFAGWPPPFFNPLEFIFNTPVDWKRKNAYIEVKVEAVPPADSAMYFWYPSVIQTWEPITPTKKVQYLPIMGIG